MKYHSEIFKVSTCISVVTTKETHFGTIVKNWKKTHSKNVFNVFLYILWEILFPQRIFHTLPVDQGLKTTQNYFGTIAAEAGRLITAFIAKSAASSQSCKRNEKQTMVFWFSITKYIYIKYIFIIYIYTFIKVYWKTS